MIPPAGGRQERDGQGGCGPLTDRPLPTRQGGLTEGGVCVLETCCETPLPAVSVDGIVHDCDLPEIYAIDPGFASGLFTISGTTSVTGNSPLVTEFTIDLSGPLLGPHARFLSIDFGYSLSDTTGAAVEDNGGTALFSGSTAYIAWGAAGIRDVTAADGETFTVRAVATWSSGPSPRTLSLTNAAYIKGFLPTGS